MKTFKMLLVCIAFAGLTGCALMETTTEQPTATSDSSQQTQTQEKEAAKAAQGDEKEIKKRWLCPPSPPEWCN